MNGLQRFERAWIAHGFLRELVLAYPVYAIMMSERGIGPFRLSLLFVFWSATVVVLEVPSGTLADRVSRKTLIVASGWIKAFCYPVWLLFPSFFGYLAGFFLWGLAGTLRSGTAQSFLHDTLAERDAVLALERVYGRGKAAERFGVGVAFLAGGVVAESGYTWVLLLSAAGPVAASLLATVAFREPTRTGTWSGAQRDSYFATMAEGLAEVRDSPPIRARILLLATAVGVSGVLDEYVGPVLRGPGSLSLTAIGAALALVAAASGVASALAHRVPIRGLRGVSWLLVAATFLLVVAGAAPGAPAAAALVVFFGACSACDVFLNAQLQRAIRGRARATIASLGGFAQEIGGILLYLLVGLVASSWNWAGALFALAVVQGVSSLWAALRRPG